MKILLLCHRLPFPPRYGSQVRAFHIARHLHQAHDLTIASLVRTRDDASAAIGLRAHCSKTVLEPVSEAASYSRALACLPTRTPSSIAYFHSPRLAAAIRKELAQQRYDLIVVHCSSMAPYVASVTDVPKLLDFCDMDSQKWLAYAGQRRFPLNLGYGLEARKLRRVEVEMARRFDLSACATRDEMETLRRYATARHAGWFSNGVDAEYFQPSARPYDPNVICFLGRMDYFPNHECVVRFCAETLPRLRQRRPGLQFHIVGAAPGRWIRRLARDPGVMVTGSVADVRPYVQRAALSIAPMRIARGTQVKILESMAMGVPVVCSPLAARGIDAVPGEHLLTATDPQQLAQTVLHVLDDAEERRRLAEAGRARMQSHHSWENAMRDFDRLTEQCLAAHASRVGATA